MRAIDLYAGVGGWSLGLALAGVEVAASYERFEPANDTNRRNNRHQAFRVDIRNLEFSELPEGIDLVVGSPPCTQFSYSNKGGGGDVVDGLKDIHKFLSIVDHVKPKFWAMENVPRVARILEEELTESGALSDFVHLGATIQILNMEDWGLPQRRKRCIAGNIDFGLLKSYAGKFPRPTLGDVVSSLAQREVIDPIYGVSLPFDRVSDHVLEWPLNEEEVRVNRAAKTTHTVYNTMPFPDPLDRSVRTITATCTRVSRESVVIKTSASVEEYRRLTLRERACLQGFPISFQFYASNHGRKATMIGNAVPPLFSYFVARACQGVSANAVEAPRSAIARFSAPVETPPLTKVDVAGHKYPKDRTFRFSVPGLNFKSGVRFELSNKGHKSGISWGVKFYFGDSKDIRQISLSETSLDLIIDSLPRAARKSIDSEVRSFRTYVANADIKRMQDVWARKGPGGTRPFDFLDRIGAAAETFSNEISRIEPSESSAILGHLLLLASGNRKMPPPGMPKLERLAPAIVAGAIAGGIVNSTIHNNDAQSVDVNDSFSEELSGGVVKHSL